MSVLSAIGNTPLVALTRINSGSDVQVLAKLERNNPGGSIKDRTALYMIKQAEASGKIAPGQTILEPTSGNTGIALAMIGAAKGYKVKLTLPGCVSTERQLILQALGAEVELTPAREGTDGAIRRAHAILEENPGKYFMPNQFANDANPQAYYETTGPEIYQQTSGTVSAVVAGMGTTGTLMGMSRYLKQKNPTIRIIGVEPTPNHSIQGLKNMTEAIIPQIYDATSLDEIAVMEDGLAFEMTRRLATEEGIFAGISSGAAVAAALQIAARMKDGVVVVILPDRGDRYLSTTLFRSVCAKCPP